MKIVAFQSQKEQNEKCKIGAQVLWCDSDNNWF